MKKNVLLLTITMFLVIIGSTILYSPEVFAAYDTTAPELKGITINTPEIIKPGVASITLDVKEEETGIVYVCVFLSRKGGGEIVDEKTVYKGEDYMYTGKHTIQVRIPSNKKPGQYYVSIVSFKDAAGNESGYYNVTHYDESLQQNVSDDLIFAEYPAIAPVENPVYSSGYITVKNEFDVDFEYSISNRNITSKINSMPEGSAGMILFTENNVTAKKEWFDAIKGKNKNLVFSNDGIQWVFNGKDITNETKDINLNITTNVAPAADYGGTGNVLVITFADNGTLPGKAKIRLKADYIIGSGLNLYYTNGSMISLERSDGKGYQDGDNSWVEFYVTHNSTFLLSKSKLTKAKDSITISKKPTSVKVKAKKNKVTVSWKKIKKSKKNTNLMKKIKKIQVQYATDQGFTKNVKIKTVSKKKDQVTLKLKRKTKYYIRLRYVGKDGYSKWTKAKKVKTK